MKSITRIIVGGAAICALGLFVSSRVVSQEKGPSKPPDRKNMDEMMAKWKELNAKGPEHKKFEKMVGTWDAEMRMWTFPGGEPTVSKGMARIRLILDGRYIEQKFQCSMMREPFEGLGIEGYDNIKKKYVSTWMDNSSTGIFMSTGTTDASGKVTTYYGKTDDPMTGQKDKVVKSIAREVHADKAVFEMYDKTPDGQEFKTMEITYTRRK